MEFKASLRDRLRRTRSSLISFSQPITLFSVKPNTNSKRPSNDITEPPCIPRDVERELRYACHRLQRRIERGIPSYGNYGIPGILGERRQTMTVPQINTAPQTQSLPATLRSPRNRYYSGLEFEVQQSEPEKDDISELYDRTARIARAESTYTARSDFNTSRIPSSATHDAAHADGEQPHSSGATLVAANDSRLSHDQRYSMDIANEPYPQVPLDLIRDLNSMPHIVPSLSRPPAPATMPARLVRKKRVENLQEESESQSQTNTDTETETETVISDKATGPRPKYRYSWLPKTATATARSVSAMELGLGVSPPVMIDSKGQRQVMSPEAEQQRQKDLQQAVREKMNTGTIKPRPVSDTHTRPCASCSNTTKSAGITNVNETGERLSQRRSILQKFSFFSFAKLKNGMPRAREAVGFSRIVDVV
ncbi:hypothetical protein SI65_02970 [Aspergillus cristatus]|uniref:Uncharacterized protein n=1 Tax=Aspergillus cristatus TaxID=573508 RepID=A0A1E3BMD1_ASPCR|nr:hypothetical protein SI65_02970 [Aspergillus cristatus]